MTLANVGDGFGYCQCHLDLSRLEAISVRLPPLSGAIRLLAVVEEKDDNHNRLNGTTPRSPDAPPTALRAHLFPLIFGFLSGTNFRLAPFNGRTC